MANLGQINQIISNNAEINTLYPLAVQGDTVEITQGIVKLHAFPAGTYTKQADGTWTSSVATENPALDKINILKDEYGIASAEALALGQARLIDASNLIGEVIAGAIYNNLSVAEQKLFVGFGDILLRSEYPSLFSLVGHNAGTQDINVTTQFRVPDGRGAFLRFSNNGLNDIFTDPDAANRVSRYTGGLSGNNVGTMQDDAFKAHHHFLTQGSVETDGGRDHGGYPSIDNSELTTNTATDAISTTGGNETRGANITFKGYMRGRKLTEAYTAQELLNIFAGV
tara:strand:+ start:10024 stop:10872 length:849 start_codon:yes stop_codon:yes gene_type:complete